MSHRITLEGGDGFDVSAGEDTLLRGALRAGVGFPYDCNVGGCGSCRFDLVAGEMETLWEEAPGLSERDRRRGKRLACQSRPRSDCTIKMRTGEEYRPPVPPRRMKAVLACRRPVTSSMSEFVLRTAEPAHFIAGQYAIFRPPGAEGARAYSMSNLPNGEGEWRFVIRRVPGGRGSNAMFDAVEIGDTLELDGPYGHAHFRAEAPRDVVCIAGGSGIGPVVSVARAAVEAMPGRRLFVFEGARTREDLCFPALMGAAQGGVAAYTPVLSAEADDSGWDGVRGFVHEEVERAVGHRAAECEFYFAGPPPMTEALQKLLIVNWTVPLARIHFDRFF
ncbi:2Fe-2S iron-sulfur cluster-binding protein [Xanthobacter sp. YC-JY1]|uniref:2Fe-2S iron-sulfur cluster-binding protein n=1 Tax=Xanthobacter sp. YC-JY1 TaxID=2419844 RepID=UPI001EFFC0E7|nr:2Fe-2S iron-sulfur cluster-binding protein [Xanthobacter sp. YC-JY1]UJX45708.1 oxidoreductase [Xanthobacter sp. YC-JY1]